MTTLQQSERDLISAIRGKWIDKTLCEVSSGGHTFALVGFGYENYPEASFFSVCVDGKLVRNAENILYSHYFDTSVMDAVQEDFPQYDLSTLMRSVGELEELPW
jgi:hypothetical protein